MTVSAFISELIRAANEVERLGDYEKRRLLERAVTTIRSMRVQMRIQPDRNAADMAINLQTTAVALSRGARTDDQVKDALLHAANAIRVLKIMLDGMAN